VMCRRRSSFSAYQNQRKFPRSKCIFSN